MPPSLKAQAPGESLKNDLKKLTESAEHAPGVYEVMHLYAEYQRVLEQSRAYLVGRHTRGVRFASTDRTG